MRFSGKPIEEHTNSELALYLKAILNGPPWDRTYPDCLIKEVINRLEEN